MRLQALEVTDFRNLEKLHLSFAADRAGLILTGHNGCGKTNILEAIVTALRGQPHRTFKSGDLVRHGQKQATLGLRLQDDNNNSHFIGYQLIGKEHQLKLDGCENPGRQQLIRSFPLVSFFPDELEAMRGEPALRRSIIDRAFGIFEDYVSCWLTYNHLLKSRNTVLRNGGNEALLMVYSQQLAKEGELLHQLRTNYFSALNDHFISACQRLGFEYQVNLQLKAGFQPGELATQLVANFERERLIGRTLQGPHLADLVIMVNGEASRHLASQGQQRLLFIAIKLAILNLYRQHLQENPLFIIDDISSELGGKYINAIYEAIPENTQLLISTINTALLPFSLQNMQIFDVEQTLSA